MDRNINKKMGSALALSLVAFTGILNAAGADDRNVESRLTALEQKKGAKSMINPPGRPVVRDGYDIFFSGEALLWKAKEDDLSYALKLDGPSGLGIGNSGRYADFKGKWDWGFRLGAGYNTGHDGWDFNLIWTRYYTKSRRHSTGNRHGIFVPTYLAEPVNYLDSGNTFVEEAHDKGWKVRLNLLDLEMGREFFVSKWLTLRPHIGGRSAWVKQKFRVEYEDGNYFTPLSGVFLTGQRVSLVSMKNNFWGIGLRGGLDTQWGLGYGFSFYGDLALSLLGGYIEVTKRNTFFSPTTSLQVNHFTKRSNVVRMIADMALGVRYDKVFADEQYALGVLFGWEYHYFPSQNKLFKFSGNRKPEFVTIENDGDFAVSGLNLGLKFDF